LLLSSALMTRMLVAVTPGMFALIVRRPVGVMTPRP